MSLYHEAADVLSAPASAGGNLKTRIFGKKDLKTSPQQVYALALETCKWSAVLKEVIDNSEILRHERKLTPVLALLLVHDFLASKGGIALPASHGLRASIERHKARLNAEFTRARLKRRAASVDAIREQVDAAYASATMYPRWVRVNSLLTTMEYQLETTFKDLTRVMAIKDVTSAPGKSLHIDEHIPNLVAVSPTFEVIKTEAYQSGALILQDKASCFPAYLLNPFPEDGDVIDSCAAPGNKTTHLAAIVNSRIPEKEEKHAMVYAFEKDKRRAKTLDKMVTLAGAKQITKISFGQDFLKVDPQATMFKDVGALLLDPSCSGSGIVGRDALPTVHLPATIEGTFKKPEIDQSKKRKRKDDAQVLVDDDGQETVIASEAELTTRLEALSSFQLILLRHAFKFPSAQKLTYSTCSIHALENEHVVLKALQSDEARERGWRILPRGDQIRGMREWPVRGSLEAADGDKNVAEACIRSYQDDGLGVMGFFVAPFVRDLRVEHQDPEGPYLRDDKGLIIRDADGMPTRKPQDTSTVVLPVEDNQTQVGSNGAFGAESEDEDDPSSGSDDSGSDDDDEWGGFED